MAKDDPQDPSSQNPESSDAEVGQAAQGSDLRRPPIFVGFLQLLILVALGWIGWQWVTWPNVKDLVENNPETTAFIELYRDGGSRSENRTVDWRWVPYREISSHLKRAVIVAEDARFFTHHGFAGEEIKEAPPLSRSSWPRISGSHRQAIHYASSAKPRSRSIWRNTSPSGGCSRYISTWWSSGSESTERRRPHGTISTNRLRN